MYPSIHKKSVGMQYLKNVGTCIPAFTKVSKNTVFKECWYMYPSIHKKSVGMQYLKKLLVHVSRHSQKVSRNAVLFTIIMYQKLNHLAM